MSSSIEPFGRESNSQTQDWLLVLLLAGGTLGLALSPDFLFAMAATAPALTIATAVLVRGETRLLLRLPPLMGAAALTVIGGASIAIGRDAPIGAILLAGGMWSFAGIWGTMGVGTLVERILTRTEGEFFSFASSSICAMSAGIMALSFLLAAISSFLPPFLSGTPIGDGLLVISDSWASTWRFRGVVLVALLLGFSGQVRAHLQNRGRFCFDSFEHWERDNGVVAAWVHWNLAALAGRGRRWVEGCQTVSRELLPQWVATLVHVCTSHLGGAALLLLAMTALLLTLSVWIGGPGDVTLLHPLVDPAIGFIAVLVSFLALVSAAVLVGLPHTDGQSLKVMLDEWRTTGTQFGEKLSLALTYGLAFAVVAPMVGVLRGRVGFANGLCVAAVAAFVVWVVWAQTREQQQSKKASADAGVEDGVDATAGSGVVVATVN